MNDVSTDTRSVMVEREILHAPEKVWRALTQPHLIEEWLAKVDFKPDTGQRFNIRIDPQPDKSFVFDCEVIAVEINRVLAYTWNTGSDGTGSGLRSTVTWRLTPTPNGTLLRVEQSGFQLDEPHYFYGARMGWPQFLIKLEQVVARIA